MFLSFTSRRNFGRALFPQHPFGSIPINEALEFISIAGITDSIQQLAIINLVNSLKRNGLWNKMTAVYPFVGGTANSHKFNLKDPRDVDDAFRLSFVGGWTHNSNGAQPNGTNGYANTFLIPNLYLTTHNTHLLFYSRTAATVNQRDIAAYTNSDNPSFSIGTASGTLVSDHYWYSSNRISASIANAQGLMIGSRISNNDHKAFRNNSQVGATDTSPVGNNTMPSIPLFLGALNGSNTPSGTTASFFSNKQYAFASIGAGLTSNEVSTLYTIIQNYQTDLSRQV
jgi:hypothetical protein